MIRELTIKENTLIHFTFYQVLRYGSGHLRFDHGIAEVDTFNRNNANLFIFIF